MQAQEGNIYFTELAERVEYGDYDLLGHPPRAPSGRSGGGAACSCACVSPSVICTALSRASSRRFGAAVALRCATSRCVGAAMRSIALRGAALCHAALDRVALRRAAAPRRAAPRRSAASRPSLPPSAVRRLPSAICRLPSAANMRRAGEPMPLGAGGTGRLGVGRPGGHRPHACEVATRAWLR